jgi:hypothetical protein
MEQRTASPTPKKVLRIGMVLARAVLDLESSDVWLVYGKVLLVFDSEVEGLEVEIVREQKTNLGKGLR